jgi:hypothetical protein
MRPVAGAGAARNISGDRAQHAPTRVMHLLPPIGSGRTRHRRIRAAVALITCANPGSACPDRASESGQPLPGWPHPADLAANSNFWKLEMLNFGSCRAETVPDRR